jgi:hypothetical protein
MFDGSLDEKHENTKFVVIAAADVCRTISEAENKIGENTKSYP